MCTAQGGGIGGIFKAGRERARIAQKSAAAQPIGPAQAEPVSAPSVGGTPRPVTSGTPGFSTVATGIQIQR